MIGKKKLEELFRMNDTQLRRALCGKVIGNGHSRQVYECKLGPQYVVKWEFSGNWDNVAEHLIWDYYKYAPWYRKWFAECFFISKSGRFVIMEKIELKNSKKEYPRSVPIFFTDISIQNFGYVGNQLKCCDYPSVIGRLTGLVGKKMRRANW